MARIPDEEIRRLKREVSLERLCSRYGIELKPQGKNLVGFCPWHGDDEPSFVVTPEKNLWHCMGACDEGGDVFTLVMKAEGISFRHAAEILLELSGAAPAMPEVKTQTGTTHPILVSGEEGMTDAELINHVADFYHRTFLNDPKAMKYLEKRCCLHGEAVKRFRIGYANRTLGYRIPATTVKGKGLKARLQALGIIRGSGHEHMSGSVVFPVTDLNGVVVQLYGRKITAGLRKGTPDHLYLEQPLRGIWNVEGIVSQREWVLCEAIIDALSLWTHGIRNVTSCFGKNTFTDDLWSLLRTVKPSKVFIAFDSDEAGEKAAEKLAPKLAAEGVSVHRARVPRGKDVNEYICTLTQRDRSAVPGILEGWLVDAPLMQRGEPGAVVLREPQGSYVDKEEASSLAASAAKKETIEAPAACTPETGVSLPVAGLEKKAAKEESSVIASDQPRLPHAPRDELPMTRTGEDIEITLGNRSYRIRGLGKNQTCEVMKINIRIMTGSAFHVDTLDLYNARHRTAFINTAAEELRIEADVIRKDLGRVLLKLEGLQDEQMKETLKPKEPKPAMTEEERDEALRLLKSPDLLKHILEGFDTWGLVGEETNKLTGYLAAVSRKLDKPLAVMIQSTSASGKSTLLDSILSMIPEEDRVQYSAMTGQSLFYLGDRDLKHKILAIVEEEGARHASYALKLLQSEGELTIASTGKDAATGQMVTREYRVEGPVMILTTTTAIDIDEELLNRCLILSVDESREQTRAIHHEQRTSETLEGLRKKLEKKDVLRLHRNAQRLLRPLQVINPYAGGLTFLDDHTRTRRDHKKYLTLIRTIAFLHQYQRPVKVLLHRGEPVRYIEATLEDIATANRLAGEVLGRSLDELPPQTRRFLDLLAVMVKEACEAKKIEQGTYRFTQREVREHINWSDYQVKTHLRKLVSLEYVLIHRGGRGQQFVYELLYSGEGRDGGKFLMGLIDVEDLRRNPEYDRDREQGKDRQEAPGSIRGGAGVTPGSMIEEMDQAPSGETLHGKDTEDEENAYKSRVAKLPSSYHSQASFLAASRR